MSFASDAKLEVLSQNIDNDCCAIAFLSALIKSSGQLNIKNKGISVEIYTEIKGVYDKIKLIIEQYYGRECVLELVDETNISKAPRYKITLPCEITDQLLKDLGVMSINEEGLLALENGISSFVITDDCCKKAYVKGAFIGCATSNIVLKNYDNKSKNNSGYHLEFVFNFEKLALDFIELLKEFDIVAKLTIRKNLPIVYIKEYQLICDALALVGAYKSVLALQNEAAIRELRNNVNRQTNCMNANINRMVKASVKQLNAIQVIQDNVGLESLDEGLMELCLLRIANPDESLDNLRKLLTTPLTKSGINHRFNKIIKYADEITKRKFKINTL